MGFNGRVAACKPHITKYNSNDQKEWSKGHCYWTLEQWKCLQVNNQKSNSAVIVKLCALQTSVYYYDNKMIQ